jgi:hypothetical protein
MGKNKIESVRIEQVIDEIADTSWLGFYTDTIEAGVIVRCHEEYYERLPEEKEAPARGREFRGFKPYAGGEKIGTDDYYTYYLEATGIFLVS